MRKKLVQINTVCNTSTGRIMHDIQKYAEEQGFETISFVGRRKVYKDVRCEKIGNGISFWIHVLINTVFDRQGYGSYFSTQKLIKRLREENPDIIHLHNLHGYYLHLPSLFRYLSKEYKGKIVWTLHDCWAFTGHCPHFVIPKCERWKTGCFKCPCKREYPISLVMDSSRTNYIEKKKMFDSVSNMVITTPSEWMAGLIKQSFFKGMPVKVISNGIDLTVFNYSPCISILEKYGISKGKKILLGVASIWNRGKGLSDFVMLSQYLTDEYEIVLVGLSRCQIKRMPINIIGIERTEVISELVALYSSAYAFINPSVEESFSLVTVEAMACGTPAIVLDTSAVKELVNNENGIVLSNPTSEDYLKAIESVENYDRQNVRRSVFKYSNDVMLQEMMHLYKQVE